MEKVTDVYRKFKRTEGLGADVPVVMNIKRSTGGSLFAKRLTEKRNRQEEEDWKSFYDLVLEHNDYYSRGAVCIGMIGDIVSRNNEKISMQNGPPAYDYATGDRYAAIGFSGEVHLLDIESRKPLKIIRHPYFDKLHSVVFHVNNPDVILISCFGANRIIQMNVVNEEIVWDWNPYDHGYTRNRLGLTLVRNIESILEGANVQILTDDIAEQVIRSGTKVPENEIVVNVVSAGIRSSENLKKWQNTFAPNWAGFVPENSEKILATSFKKDQVVEIDVGTGRVRVLFDHLADELVTPHVMSPIKDGFILSDTGNGRVLFFDRQYRHIMQYSFAAFPTERELDERCYEWLQSTHPISKNLLATVDSRRSRVFIWNALEGIYDWYKYSPEWIVQSVVPYERIQRGMAINKMPNYG